MPREVILDSQGRAIENSMKSNGYKLDSVRAGKYLEIAVPDGDKKAALENIEKMLNEGGLFNPLIEKYDINFI